MTTLMNYFASPIAGEWGDEAEDCTDGVPVLRTTNFTADGRLSYDDLTFRAIDTEKKKDKILKPGDIIIEKSGGTPKKPVGRCVYFDRDDDYDYFCSNFTAVLRANPETVNTKYLWYILQEHYKTRQCLKYQYKTNGIANLDITDYLSHIEVDLPSRDVQDKRVEAMDYSQHLLDIHQELLDIMDKAVKSRFIEMFGDLPLSSNMQEVCKIITDGTHQPPKFVSTGIPFIFVSNIVNDYLTYNAEKYISEDTYNELVKRTPIEIGDVLLSTVGSYGHPAIVESNCKFLFQRHIAYLKPDHNKINSRYLHALILSDEVQRQIDSKVKGIAQKTLNLSEIKSLQIPLPEMELQNQFADFVALADKSKLTIQKSLENLTELRESLMQEYFG